MKSESGYLGPGQSQDRQRAPDQVAPIGWRKYAVLEIRADEMKVRDEKNRQPF